MPGQNTLIILSQNDMHACTHTHTATEPFDIDVRSGETYFSGAERGGGRRLWMLNRIVGYGSKTLTLL